MFLSPPFDFDSVVYILKANAVFMLVMYPLVIPLIESFVLYQMKWSPSFVRCAAASFAMNAVTTLAGLLLYLLREYTGGLLFLALMWSVPAMFVCLLISVFVEWGVLNLIRPAGERLAHLKISIAANLISYIITTVVYFLVIHRIVNYFDPTIRYI